MRRYRRIRRGTLVSCFGAGLIASFVLPYKTVIILLAIAIICLGITDRKC